MAIAPTSVLDLVVEESDTEVVVAGQVSADAGIEQTCQDAEGLPIRVELEAPLGG